MMSVHGNINQYHDVSTRQSQSYKQFNHCMLLRPRTTHVQRHNDYKCQHFAKLQPCNTIIIIHEFHSDASLEQNFRAAMCHVLHYSSCNVNATVADIHCKHACLLEFEL